MTTTPPNALPPLRIKLVGGPRDGETITVTDPKTKRLELTGTPNITLDPDDIEGALETALDDKAIYVRRTKWEGSPEAGYTAEAHHVID